MFREYTRRRELALGRSAAYKFVIDGESIESEHTARMVHLGERDVGGGGARGNVRRGAGAGLQPDC